MQQLEQALLDLTQRAETLPPEVLINRVEARLTSEGLLPIEGESVQEPSLTPKRFSPLKVPTRLQRTRLFALAFILTLVAIGITALMVRNGNAPISDEPAPPTTTPAAPTLPLTEALLTTVPEPLAPTTIALAGTGDIWVGAVDGIWRFSDEETSRKGRGDVADLTVAPNGTVWAAFWSGNTFSVAGLENETWVNHPQPNGDFGNITANRDGTLWWAGSSGLHRLEGREWVIVDEALPQAFDVGQRGTLEVRVEAAPDGTMWVGAWWGMVPEAGGLTRFDGTEWDEIPLPRGNATAVYNLAVAPNGDLWVVLVESVPGTAGSWSLARFDGDTWSVFSEADGMPQSIVYSMAVGPDGVVWLTQLANSGIPEASGGVVAFDGEQWTPFLEDENVQDVVVDSDGTIWLAGDRLYKIER